MATSLTASFILKLEDQLSSGIVALSRKLEALAKLSKQVTLSGLDAADRTLDRVGAAADRAGEKVGGIGRKARSAAAELDKMAIRVNAAGTAFLPPALARAAMAATILAAAGGVVPSGRVPGLVPPSTTPFASSPLLLGSSQSAGIPLAPLCFIGRNAGAFSAISSGAAAARAHVAQLGHQVQDLGKHMGELGHASLTAFATGFGLMHPISEYAKYENTLRHIAITAGVERAEIPKVVGELTKQYNSLAIASGQSSEKIAESANFLITTGIGREAVDKLLPIVARASTAYNANIGDSVQAIFSLKENLHVADGDMAGTMSAMALAGKEGHFSFSDMSRFLPDIAPLAAGAGLKGASGARDLFAMLETSRRNAGTSGEAETNLRDFLSHLFGDNKRGLGHSFAQHGVNLEKLLLDAEKKGISAPEAVLEQVRRMTAGKSDIQKNLIIGSLFHNQQSAQFVRGALNDIDYLQKLREKLRSANAHTIDEDFLKAIDAPLVKLRILIESLGQVVQRVGKGFAGGLDPMILALNYALIGIENLDARWALFTAHFKTHTGAAGLRSEALTPALPMGLDKALLAIGGSNALDTILGLVGGVLALSAALGLLIPLFKVVGGGARLLLAPLVILRPILFGLGYAAAAVGALFGVGIGAALVLIITLGTALYALYDRWELVKATFGALWDGIKELFAEFASWLANSWLGQAGSYVIERLKALWVVLSGWFGDLWSWVQDTFDGFVEWIKGSWVVTTVASAIERIKDAWSKLTTFFRELVNEWRQPFEEFVKKIDETIAKLRNSPLGKSLGLGEADPNAPGPAAKPPVIGPDGLPLVPVAPINYRGTQGGGTDQLLINIKVDQDGRVRAVDPTMPGGRAQLQVDRGDMMSRA